MCIGIPMQVIGVDGILGIATDGRASHKIDLSLTGPVEPGTWVLTFLGAARDVMTEDEARKASAAVGALQDIMSGGEAGDAFADLDARNPSLPPHLQAALDAGKTTG